MVQIIPQDVPAAARFAGAISPQIGEGFATGMGRGVELQQQTAAQLQREQQMRQMNLQALQESPFAKKFPGLFAAYETQAKLGQPVDMQEIAELQLTNAILKGLGLPPLFTGEGGAQQGLAPNADDQDFIGSPMQAEQAPLASTINAKDRIQSGPIENENDAALRYSQNQPRMGPMSLDWNAMTPEQRIGLELRAPKVANALRNAAMEERAREQTFREIDDARANQLNAQLDPWYNQNKLEDPEFDVPKKILANQTAGMDNVQAQSYMKNKLQNFARELKAYRNVTDKLGFSAINTSDADQKELVRIGKKFDDMGLGEYYRGKLAETFPTDFQVEAIINPLDARFKNDFKSVKDRSNIFASVLKTGGLGYATGLLGNVLDNNYSEPTPKDIEPIKKTLRKAIPEGQSLYAIRQHLQKKRIPPSWIEKAVRDLQAEGVQLNERQNQEMSNLGQSDSEYIASEIGTWFDSLKGAARKAAAFMFSAQ
ncbi:MAG: hypothetical protein PVI43_01285 [Candidatus Bathyarchaeota archaeon]|jgi:hypothetical protein